MPKFIFSLIPGFFLLERVALACATCGFVDESTAYYHRMIIFMTAIPVLFIGGVVYYLRKQQGRNDSNEQ